MRISELDKIQKIIPSFTLDSEVKEVREMANEFVRDSTSDDTAHVLNQHLLS